MEHQRVDGDGEERGGGADDLVEGDSYEVAVWELVGVWFRDWGREYREGGWGACIGLWRCQ